MVLVGSPGAPEITRTTSVFPGNAVGRGRGEGADLFRLLTGRGQQQVARDKSASATQHVYDKSSGIIAGQAATDADVEIYADPPRTGQVRFHEGQRAPL